MDGSRFAGAESAKVSGAGLQRRGLLTVVDVGEGSDLWASRQTCQCFESSVRRREQSAGGAGTDGAHQGADLRAIARYFTSHVPASVVGFKQNAAAELVKAGSADTGAIDATVLRFLDDSPYVMWISVSKRWLRVRVEAVGYTTSDGVRVMVSKELIYSIDGSAPRSTGQGTLSQFASGWWEERNTYT